MNDFLLINHNNRFLHYQLIRLHVLPHPNFLRLDQRLSL